MEENITTKKKYDSDERSKFFCFNFDCSKILIGNGSMKLNLNLS